MAKSTSKPPARSPDPWLALGLALLTVAAFEGLSRCGFVALDDPQYVTRNPAVLDGLSLRGIAWAVTSSQASNWHPLTWLSHMLDVSLFGVQPLGHHATSLALHVANTLVFYFALARGTGARWRSALAAALFAVHPLRVESVAWIAERKDVLCAFFYLLALAAHGRFARGERRAYALAVTAQALALLAKPMAVSLPLALLITDFWPLRRPLPIAALVREKLPFFALAAVSCGVTLAVQLSTGASPAWLIPPLASRLLFVPVAYVTYLRMTFWPSGLGVLYPHPGASLSVGAAIASAALLGAVTALAIRSVRTRPWLLAGWAWFGVTLLPVIGFVDVGFQGVADRYTYLPSLGLATAVAFGAAELAQRVRAPAALRAAICTLVLGALAGLTHLQVAYWRDGLTLFERTLAVTENNFAIHGYLAAELAGVGRRDEERAHLLEALRIRPDFPFAHYGLAVMDEESGQSAEAIAEYRVALRVNPDYTNAHYNLAVLLARSGVVDEAAEHYRRVLALDPANANARQGLAYAEEAIRRRGAPAAR